MKNYSVILFLVAIVVFVDAKPKDPCDKGWTPFGNKCYSFRNTALTWEEAREACEEDGAYLVRINSKSENEFLVANALGKHGYWTGGNDKCKEGTWVWESNGKPFTYVNWSKGNPDSYKGGEDCMLM